MIEFAFEYYIIVTQKEKVWIHGSLSQNMLKIRGQIFQNVFENHQGGDNIEGILSFLDSNAMIAIAKSKQFRD